jgi:hypothetical protein
LQSSFLIRVSAERERRRRLQTRSQAQNQYDQFRVKYRNDPAGFARDCITWSASEGGLVWYQERTLTDLAQSRRATIRGPHGLGKTTLAAIAILWFALTRDGEDWKIPTTASAWRQLIKFLWPEIHKWTRRLRWDVIGRQPFNERTELLQLSLKLSTGEAFAMASDNPALIEGAHAAELLYIFDESKAISAPTWDAAEGAFSTGSCYWLAVSTPGEPNGRFYELHKRAPGYEDWKVQRVTRADAIAAGRMSPEWAEQRRKQWGEKSAVYLNRVEGEFATSDEDGVIALAWIERSNERWLARMEHPEALPVIDRIGLDVGRGGDPSVFALGRGNLVAELRRMSIADTMAVAGAAHGILSKFTTARAVLDVIGVGAGVFDRLREEKAFARRLVAFVAGARTDHKDKSGEWGFADMRSAGWWTLRELLEDDALDLPPDDKLTGDLTAPRWRALSGGRYKVEEKDEIKKRLRRSTDDGDAVMMLYAPENKPKERVARAW